MDYIDFELKYKMLLDKKERDVANANADPNSMSMKDMVNAMSTGRTK